MEGLTIWFLECYGWPRRLALHHFAARNNLVYGLVLPVAWFWISGLFGLMS